MYDYKWDEPGIRECRGHVYHRDSGALVTLPPTKTFNHEEVFAEKFNPKQTVFAYEKHNGSMLAVSKFNDELICTTTGSFDSEGKSTRGFPQGLLDLRAALDFIEGEGSLSSLPVLLFGNVFGLLFYRD